MGHPSLASEFPNDNAAISGGAIWVCPELTGPASCEVAVAPYEPVPNEPFVLWFEDADDYVDEPHQLELTPDSGHLSTRVALPAAADEPETLGDAQKPEPVAFCHFEAALVSALLAHGSTRSAALLPRMLRLESLAEGALAKDVQLTLQSRGYLDGSARYSAKFRDVCGAWSAVLRGSSQDFAACGTTTLDRFGAELLAALMAVPSTRIDELRRDLRKAGVAAFGVLVAA